MCQLNCIQQSDKCNYNFSFESNQIFHIKRNFSAKNAHSVCDLEDACSVPLMLETPQKVGISWQAFCSSHFHNIQLDFK